jgi:hypothetical protein
MSYQTIYSISYGGSELQAPAGPKLWKVYNENFQSPLFNARKYFGVRAPLTSMTPTLAIIYVLPLTTFVQ